MIGHMNLKIDTGDNWICVIGAWVGIWVFARGMFKSAIIVKLLVNFSYV